MPLLFKIFLSFFLTIGGLLPANIFGQESIIGTYTRNFGFGEKSWLVKIDIKPDNSFKREFVGPYWVFSNVEGHWKRLNDTIFVEITKSNLFKEKSDEEYWVDHYFLIKHGKLKGPFLKLDDILFLPKKISRLNRIRTYYMKKKFNKTEMHWW